jgi:hypothetical protein
VRAVERFGRKKSGPAWAWKLAPEHKRKSAAGERTRLRFNFSVASDKPHIDGSQDTFPFTRRSARFVAALIFLAAQKCKPFPYERVGLFL